MSRFVNFLLSVAKLALRVSVPFEWGMVDGTRETDVIEFKSSCLIDLVLIIFS